MHILERENNKYYYACENVWRNSNQKPQMIGKCIDCMDSDNSLTPNRHLAQLFSVESLNSSSLTEYEKQIIKTVIEMGWESVIDYHAYFILWNKY